MCAMRCRPAIWKTLQGVVSFDENGDIKDRTVSVFQDKHDAKSPEDDLSASKPLYRRGSSDLSAQWLRR